MSPVRRQYLELKARYRDAILFFRLGDFFETFDDDASVVAAELEIALTSRELGRGERVPMAGIPCSAVDSYAAKLIARGYRVAICEQLSEPNGRGPVERGVVRVISPGTVVEDALVAPRQNTYLAAVIVEGRAASVAHLDASTGYLAACEVSGSDFELLLDSELCRIGPSECLLVDDEQAGSSAQPELPSGCRVTLRPAESFSPRRAAEVLRQQFGLDRLDALGLQDATLAARAAAALLAYLDETLPGSTAQFHRLERYDLRGFMLLDATARRNLELTTGLQSGGRDGSLLSILDQTSTAMGSRLLRSWLTRPLLDLDRIAARHDGIDALLGDRTVRIDLAALLVDMPDLERLAGRAFQGRLGPRDSLALAHGLARVEQVGNALERLRGRLGPLALDPVREVGASVLQHVSEDPPAVVGPGTIRTGISAELDELRVLSGDTRQWIASLERQERERTGVGGLKVGHNRVYGYFLEVSQAVTRQPTDYHQRQQSGADDIAGHLEQLGYARKQTLAGVERYVTPELKDRETRVSQAEHEAERLERRLYAELLEGLKPFAARVRTTAEELARLDCLLSLAEVAETRRFVRPKLDSSTELSIQAGRHPVVEASLGIGEFVPNDVVLGEDGARILVVTGPNMAGKSTFLRQVGLIALMGQIGSFVPADRARLGMVDRVFTRIGAHDDLAGRRSTFMVEMMEAAMILRNATSRSLVILDEVGRGTSTYDGLALARAILEHLDAAPGLQCRTLFATHYHELASLEAERPSVRSVHMEVLDSGRQVVFLHRVAPGVADRSYGIHVARLAGIPAEVTARAEILLEALETDGRPLSEVPHQRWNHDQRLAFELADRVRGLNVMKLTPLQALAELQTMQDLVHGTGLAKGE